MDPKLQAFLDKIRAEFDQRVAQMEARSASPDDMNKLFAERETQIREAMTKHFEDKLAAEVDARNLVITELRGEVKEIRQAQIRTGRPGQGGGEAPMTLGRAIVEGDDYKAMAERGFKTNGVFKLDLRTITTEAIVYQDPLREGSIDIVRRTTPSVKDAMPVYPAGSNNSVEYTEEIHDYVLFTEVTEDVANGATDIPVRSVAGLLPGYEIMLDAGADVPIVRTIDAIDQPDKESRRGTITVTVAIDRALTKDMEVAADKFAPTKEGQFRSAGKFAEKRRVVPMRNMTTEFTVTKQTLRTHDRFQRKINEKIPRNIALSENAQAIHGPGGDDEMLGFFAHPGIKTRLWSTGVTRDTTADAIARGASDVWNSGYMATHVFVHNDDWTNHKLTKNERGDYMYRAETTGPGGQKQIHELIAIVTNDIPKGKALVGDFSQCAEWHEDANIEINVYPQHDKYASLGLVLVGAERYCTLAITIAAGFRIIEFDAPPV